MMKKNGKKINIQREKGMLSKWKGGQNPLYQVPTCM